MSGLAPWLSPLVYRDGRLDMVRFAGGYATVATGGSVTFHYYTSDYLGSNRAVVNGSTGAVEQTVAYYPYGGIIADLGFGLGRQPFKFGGKELISANGLNEYDFGARQYWHAVPGFNRIDPLCENFYWLSPYLYCGNDPVNAFDPDGKETKVIPHEGNYKVVGGSLDNDLNIYIYYKNGNTFENTGISIGVSATIRSFYDSDKNEWKINSVIDLNDKSGIKFLSEIENNTPSLVNYIWNARQSKKYDFKTTNGTNKPIAKIDPYRGMPIGTDDNGKTIIASARDIGNIAAGYVAGVNGLSWELSRLGFDAYETYTHLPEIDKKFFKILFVNVFIQNIPLTIIGPRKVIDIFKSKWIEEGDSTVEAEKYGWDKGSKRR